MFKFFKKNKEVKKTENTVTFGRANGELMDDPSFSLLLQLNKDTGEYIIAIDTDDYSSDNSEITATLLCNLTHAALNKTILEALDKFPDDNEEKAIEYVSEVLEIWGMYEEELARLVAKKQPKRKIDPSKIFNIRGDKHE